MVFIRRFQITEKNIKHIYKRKYTIESYYELICFLKFVVVFLALFAYTLLSIWLVWLFRACLSKCKYWCLSASLPPQRRGAISYDSSDQTALYIRMLGKHHLPCLMHTPHTQPVNKFRHTVDVPLCTGSYQTQHIIQQIV